VVSEDILSKCVATWVQGDGLSGDALLGRVAFKCGGIPVRVEGVREFVSGLHRAEKEHRL